MKTNIKKWVHILNVCLLVGTSIVLTSCQDDPLTNNQSSLATTPLNSPFPMTYASVKDNNGEYLYVVFREFITASTQIRKIKLDDLSNVADVVIPGHQLFGGDNLVYTSDNKLMLATMAGQGIHFVETFDADLNRVALDTFVKGTAYTRVLLNRNDIGGVDVVFNAFNDTGANYTRWAHMSNSLEELEAVEDVSPDYNAAIITQNFIPTSDGGSFMGGINLVPPFYTDDIILEKRDKNFNLQWRTKFATTAVERPGAIAERDGKFYVYGNGTNPDKGFESQLFVLEYDKDGNLLKNQPITSGALDDGHVSMMMPTEEGFLIAGLTTIGNTVNARSGILYTLDENLNVTGSRLFGGPKGVTAAILTQLSENRYLLIYADNSFGPTQGYRLVMEYVNASGELIK